MSEALSSFSDALPAVRLARMDLRKAAATLGRREARYLVERYYMMQEYRKRSGNQVRALEDGDEPHDILDWSLDVFGTVEKSIKSALGIYAQAQRPGNWAMSIHGVGPVIAAGLLAHIDVNPWRCPHTTPKQPPCTPDEPCGPECGRIVVRYAGQVWKFAGIEGKPKWNKGEVRPWNARLKRLMWIIGDSFVKHRNSPKDIYGKLYDKRKAHEIELNESGAYAELAARTLEERNFKDKKTIATYKSGRLPDGWIDARARRIPEKMFLSHYHHVAYECHFGEPPATPYAIQHLGHDGYMPPPGWKL